MTAEEARQQIVSGLGDNAEPALAPERIDALLALALDTILNTYTDAGVDVAIEIGLRWKLAKASEFAGSDSPIFSQVKQLLDEHMAKRRNAYALVNLCL